MYTTTPSNWPKAAAQRLQERHSEPRPPSVWCTDSPRDYGLPAASSPTFAIGKTWGDPGPAALRLGPLGVIGDAGAAARASSGRRSAQRGALNHGQVERRAEAILDALAFADRPMTNSEITAASARRDLTHSAMSYALTKLIQDGRVVATRHGAAGPNWYSLPAWGKDRRLPDPGAPRAIPEHKLDVASKRLRRALEQSGYPMTNAALAAASGVPNKRVGAYTKRLRDCGAIVRTGEPGRYFYSMTSDS